MRKHELHVIQPGLEEPLRLERISPISIYDVYREWLPSFPQKDQVAIAANHKAQQLLDLTDIMLRIMIRRCYSRAQPCITDW